MQAGEGNELNELEIYQEGPDLSLFSLDLRGSPNGWSQIYTLYVNRSGSQTDNPHISLPSEIGARSACPVVMSGPKLVQALAFIPSVAVLLRCGFR